MNSTSTNSSLRQSPISKMCLKNRWTHKIDLSRRTQGRATESTEAPSTGSSRRGRESTPKRSNPASPQKRTSPSIDLQRGRGGHIRESADGHLGPNLVRRLSRMRTWTNSLSCWNPRSLWSRQRYKRLNLLRSLPHRSTRTSCPQALQSNRMCSITTVIPRLPIACF